MCLLIWTTDGFSCRSGGTVSTRDVERIRFRRPLWQLVEHAAPPRPETELAPPPRVPPASTLKVHLSEIAIEAAAVDAEVDVLVSQVPDRLIAISVDEIETPQIPGGLDKIDDGPRRRRPRRVPG
jgi:hypothetical protein